nr:MAG TPA: protein of unknown function (DUF1082) [Caudoviricetes sp.]
MNRILSHYRIIRYYFSGFGEISDSRKYLIIRYLL